LPVDRQAVVPLGIHDVSGALLYQASV
jgi:hypothetical protein